MYVRLYREELYLLIVQLSSYNNYTSTSKFTCPNVQESIAQCLVPTSSHQPTQGSLLNLLYSSFCYTYLDCLLQLPVPIALQSPTVCLCLLYLYSTLSPVPSHSVLYLLSYSQPPMPIQLPCLLYSCIATDCSAITKTRLSCNQSGAYTER